MSKNQSNVAEAPVQRHQRIRTEANRETVEAIVVAIILALLFRAFVAEAFVIPTGSMAPALMGAHKDLTCPECGMPYQVGASIETSSGAEETTVVGSVCPNCRKVNSLDLAGNRNHSTFAGDRILVSKFAYALSDPERWDVIVFKYPGNPKQNYIKRLVGMPNETLRIRFGDVFAKPSGSDDFTILRKPHDKLMAMSHTVNNTAYQAGVLIAADYPSNWQPWAEGATAPPSDSWQIERSADSWTATVEASGDEPKYLRYFHRWPDDKQWAQAAEGMTLSNVDPYSSFAITDFYPYDAYVNVNARQVYSYPPGEIPKDTGKLGRAWYGFSKPRGELREDYQSGGDISQFGFQANIGRQGTSRIGYHWVGDLILEADVSTEGSGGELILELVESAVLFQCRINLESGVAKMQIVDSEGPVSFADAGGTAAETPTATTKVRAGGSYNLRMANCDDQLYLWVNGKPIEFAQPTVYDMSKLRTLEDQRPFSVPGHPYDAAPVAIAAVGTKAKVERLQVMRDKYYVAVDQEVSIAFNDYNLSDVDQRYRGSEIQKALQDPSNWEDLAIWGLRRTVEFVLEENQFFPMGDNSPESEDARCWVRRSRNPYTGQPVMDPTVDPDAYVWSNASFVPRDLLVGKALMVFWPHTWNTPIPFTPNVKRIGFIR
jgi:signal peptidase I